MQHLLDRSCKFLRLLFAKSICRIYFLFLPRIFCILDGFGCELRHLSGFGMVHQPLEGRQESPMTYLPGTLERRQWSVADTSNNCTTSSRSLALKQNCLGRLRISTNDGSSSSSDVSSSDLVCRNSEPLLSIKLRNVRH